MKWLKKRTARLDPIAAADARWTEANAEKRAAGCPCGGPAEVCDSYPTAGTVRAEFWTCYEHADADGWSQSGDDPAIPTYNRSSPCDGCGTARLCHGGTFDAVTNQQKAWSCEIPETADARSTT